MGLFLLPQIGTDLYSLNTNRTNYTNICLIRSESVGDLFDGKDIKTTETAVLTCSDRFHKSIFYFNFISIKIMPKSSFMAVNRQFGAFLRSELERQGMTFSMLRKRCHFDNNALTSMKKV